MDENQTAIADESSIDVKEVFTYNFFKNTAWKWVMALSFIAINAFLVIVPFISTKNTDGTPRKIPTWLLPLVVLPMYLLGAVAAVFIMAWAPQLNFKGSNGPTTSSFVPYNSRRWIMQYKGLKRQSLEEFRRRWNTNGEKVEALRLRTQVALGPLQSYPNGGIAYTTGAAAGNLQLNVGTVLSSGAIQPVGGTN
jgi:hypothetical protein